MKAFWWFNDSIAGMARPGLNAVHWARLPFDEAVLFGWLGKYPSGSHGLESFRAHLEVYAPKVFQFYKLDEQAGKKTIEIFNKKGGLEEVLHRLVKNTKALGQYEMKNDALHFSYCQNRLRWEMNEIKQKGIKTIISLTEHHHHKEQMSAHFDLHHFGIEDLNAPQPQQVHELAKVIEQARKKKEKLAVHCLAGIGRTSTMLMAAHMALGENPQDLEKKISKQNPFFVLTGPQAHFIHSFVKG